MAKSNGKSGGSSGSSSGKSSTGKSGAANVRLPDIPRLNQGTSDKSSAKGGGSSGKSGASNVQLPNIPRLNYNNSETSSSSSQSQGTTAGEQKTSSQQNFYGQQESPDSSNGQEQGFYGKDNGRNEESGKGENKTSGFYGKQEESVNGREAAEEDADMDAGWAALEEKSNEKDHHAENYRNYLNEADRLTIEKTNSEGLTMEELDEYDRQIKEAKDKAEEERKAAGIKSAKDKWDELRSAPLLSDDEQEAWAFLQPNEDVENQVGGWGRQFAAGPTMTVGTALEWFDKTSDDMVRYEYDQEHGEGAYDRAIAGKNVNQVGQLGNWIWDTGVGLQESGQQMWEAGTADMSELGKEIANVAKAGADIAADAGLNLVLPGLGTMRMYMGAMGNAAYEQSQRENNDIDSRMLSMVKAGASAYLSNKLAGDVIYGKGIVPKGIGKMLSQVSPELQKVIRPLLNSEWLDEGLENILNWGGDIILGLDTGKPLNWNEVKQDAFIGYVLGVLTNGLAGGMNIDAAKQKAIAQGGTEFAELVEQVGDIDAALAQAAEIGKQNTRDQVVMKAKPESETSSPAAQPKQDSTGTEWTGDWGSWVNAALSGGALSDTDVDTIYNRPAARQAFEEATGISLDGMSEEEAKATIGMAAGTQTTVPTTGQTPATEATSETGSTPEATTETGNQNNGKVTYENPGKYDPNTANFIDKNGERIINESKTNTEPKELFPGLGFEYMFNQRSDGTFDVVIMDEHGLRVAAQEFDNANDALAYLYNKARNPYEDYDPTKLEPPETNANEMPLGAEPTQEANDTAGANPNQEQANTNENPQQNHRDRKPDHSRKVTNPNEETDAEFDKLNEKHGSIEPGENPARDINVPKKDTKGLKVGEGARTIFEADATPEERIASLKAAVVNGNFGHIPVSNDVRSQNAAKKLAKDGWSRSVSDFLSAVDTGKVDADTIALGAHLLNEAGNSTECSGKQYVELAMAYDDAVHGSAQALAAGRILKTLTPEGKLYGMEKTIEKMNREIRKNNEGKKASKQKAEIKLNEQLVEDYLNAKTDEERAKIHDKLVKDAAEQVPNTFRDKFTALRYLNMLGNFKTQFRNLAGNTGMTVVQKVKNEARGAIEGLVKAASGGKYDRQYKGGPGLAKRLKVASEDFLSDADLQALAMGEKKFSDVAKQSESEIKDAKDPFSNKNPLGKFLNAYSKATNAAMEFGDLIFVRANYADALAGYMNAHNISEADWKAMVNDPAKSAEVDKARAFAIKQAQEATFRDTNAVSKFASTFDQRWGDNGNPVGKAIKKGAQGVIPFRKTPANVLVRMEEYSPLGVINTAVKGIQAAKGTAEVSEVIDSAAKTLTGSGLTVLGILAAAAKNARTKDDDKDEEAFAKLQGKQDYSIEVNMPEFLGGGRRSITMDWLSPASAPFFMGVEAYNLYKEGGFGLSDLINATMSITNPMLEMSMLSGVNDALDNLNDFSGDNSALLQFALNSAWSYLTQGISNTMLGQMEQFSEKNRQTYYTLNEEGKLPTSFQKKIAKLGNKTPGVDYQSADYIDAWGRKQANDQNLAERAWNVFLNPAYVSDLDKKATEADAVIENLLEFGKTQKERDDFPNVVPRTPSRNETVNGKKLSPEEYDVYATTKGQESLKAVTELSKSDIFKGMDEFSQAEAIYAAYEYAEFLAASKIAKSRGEEYKDSRYDGLEDTDHPAIVVGAKAGFNDAMNHENWDGVDSLLKAANSGKMSNADREFLEDNVDKFWKYSDAAADGLKAQTLNSFDAGVKDLYTSEHRTAENGGDVLDTVVDQYNSGKISLKEADALMGREDRRNENKIHEQLDYELKKVGKGDADVEKIWSMLEQFDTGEIDKPAIVKEAIKNVPKKDQARIKNVITSWTKTRARAGFGRTTVYNAMRNASDDYTPADIQKFWEIVDANGDGTLSKTEYKNKKSKIPKEYRDDVTKYLYDAMGWK